MNARNMTTWLAVAALGGSALLLGTDPALAGYGRGWDPSRSSRDNDQRDSDRGNDHASASATSSRGNERRDNQGSTSSTSSTNNRGGERHDDRAASSSRQDSDRRDNRVNPDRQGDRPVVVRNDNDRQGDRPVVVVRTDNDLRDNRAGFDRHDDLAVAFRHDNDRHDNDRHDDHGNYDRHDNDRHDRDHGPVIIKPRPHDGPTVIVGFGGPVVCPPPVVWVPPIVTNSTWVPGHYETQTTQVLVEPGHWETQVVERVTQTHYPLNGPPYTVVVQEGSSKMVWVQERYEARSTQVWVPGHYETCAAPPVVCPPPVVVEPSWRFSIGGIFHF